MICLYPISGVGAEVIAANKAILQRLRNWVGAYKLLFLILGDWNMTPQELEALKWLPKLSAATNQAVQQGVGKDG